jgi:hypothetical protein
MCGGVSASAFTDLAYSIQNSVSGQQRKTEEKELSLGFHSLHGNCTDLELVILTCPGVIMTCTDLSLTCPGHIMPYTDLSPRKDML